MSKTTLNDNEFMQQVYDAVNKGDAGNLDNLMNTDIVEVLQPKEGDVTEGLSLLPPEEAAKLEEGNPDEGAADGADPTKVVEKKEEEAPVDDWRSKLPDDVRAVVEKEIELRDQQNARLNQYYKSNEGRVSSLHKKINALQSKIQGTEEPAKKPAPAPVALDEDEFLTDLKENDPRMYEGIRAREAKLLAAANQQIEGVKKEFQQVVDNAINPFREQEQNRHLELEAEKVRQVVPDVAEIVTSDAWKQFKTVVPPGVRAMAESSDSEEFLTAIWMFSQYAGAPAPAQQQQQQKVVDTSAATKLAEERERKLKAGGMQGKPPASSVQENMSEEKMIEDIYQKLKASETYITQVK